MDPLLFCSITTWFLKQEVLLLLYIIIPVIPYFILDEFLHSRRYRNNTSSLSTFNLHHRSCRIPMLNYYWFSEDYVLMSLKEHSRASLKSPLSALTLETILVFDEGLLNLPSSSLLMKSLLSSTTSDSTISTSPPSSEDN